MNLLGLRFVIVAATWVFAWSASGALSVKAELNPDPIQPSETLEVQVTVSSTSTSGSLVLRLLWPAAMGSQAPIATGGGDCAGVFCEAGEQLNWALGSLGPGSSITVGFAAPLPSGATNGVISFPFELLEGGSSRATFTKNATVEIDSPLELALDPLADPVAASSQLTYELVYGNTSSQTAVGGELSWLVPAGTHYLSASGNGQLVGGRVVWDLGNVTAGSGGRERVTVLVGALATSTLLAVEEASFSGTINSLPKIARAQAVSRVAPQALQLKLEVDPDPLATNELIDTQVTVSNPTSQSSGVLTLRLWWPEELRTAPFTTGGGDCPGVGCDPGETLVYSIGILPPFSTRVLAVNTGAFSLANGRLIPFELELIDGALAARSLSHTLIQGGDSPLELRVDPLADPVAAGGRLAYELTFGNTGNAAALAAQLLFPLPAGSQLVAASHGGTLDQGVVRFDLGDLAPHAWGRRRVEVLVPSLPAGSILAVDAAEISGQVNFLPRLARAMAASRVGVGTIAAAAEMQADPAAPGELVDTQITILNGGSSPTGSLSLRLLWPQELGSAPVTTASGACPGVGCDPGEYLAYTIGVLGPGTSQVVAVNAQPFNGPDGAVIPFEIELLEADQPVSTLSRSGILDGASPLELAIDPRADPVPAGGLLTYDLSYGNLGAAVANAAVMSFPIPAGATFVGATGDGHLVSGRVVWPLGTLAPNSGGRVQVQVRIAGTPVYRILEIRDAELSATVSGLPEDVRASAVSRVGVINREVALAITPNPADSGQIVTGQLTVTNPTGSATGTLELRLLWPDGLNSSPSTTAAGDCPGVGCDPGEYLTWPIGILGPGASSNVSFSENLLTQARGTLVPFEVELIEGGFPARNRSQTVLVQAPSPDGDGDGVPNILDPDDDNDGMPDTWEIRYGFNPLNAADATQDPDHDGLVNRDEFRLGYHPLVADYVFADGFESGGTTRWH